MPKENSSAKRIYIRVILNSVLGVVLIFVWSRFVNFSEITGILGKVEFKYVLVFVGFFSVSGLLRSLRLKILLKGYKLPLRDIVLLSFLSQFLSFMIPIRAGELTKSVYLTSQFGLPLGKTVVWVFVDRFLDFWAVLLMITLSLFLIPTILPANLAKTIFLLLIAMTVMTVFILKSQQLTNKLLRFFSNLLVLDSVKTWFLSFTQTIVEGFAILSRSPAALTSMMLLTVVATLSDAMIWISVFYSLQIDFPVAKMIFGSFMTALTFIVPAAPGYVGSAEAAGLAVFSGILGMGTNLSSAALVLFHILTLITLPVFGITSLYFLKFDLKLVWKKLRRG